MNTFRIDKLFPGWRVVRRLGAGGFGSVYEIEHTILDETEKSALKVIRIPQDDNMIPYLRNSGYDDAQIRGRLLSDAKNVIAEYKNIRKVSSAHVVECSDIQLEQDPDGLGCTVYLRMELLTPLMERLRYSFQPQQTAIALGKDICSALVVCEKMKIVHRDIKPQNLFVNKADAYKLGDFGIAREMEHTTAATKIGSFAYMSPEVFHHRPYGSNVDTYSLGLVMYWILNNRRLPFMPNGSAIPTAAEEEQALIRRITGEQLPPPVNGSRELQRIVLKACEANPANRYASAGDMLRDLQALDANSASVSSATEGNGFVMRDAADANTADPNATQYAAEGTYVPYRPPQSPPAPDHGGFEDSAPKKETKKVFSSLESFCHGCCWLGAVFSGFFVILMMLIELPAGRNPFQNFFVGEPGGVGWVTIVIAFVLSVIVLYGRRMYSEHLKLGMTIVMIVTFILAWATNSIASAMSDSKSAEEKKTAIVVTDDRIVIDNQYKADLFYKEMDSKTPEEIKEKYGTDTVIIKNCKKDIALSAGQNLLSSVSKLSIAHFKYSDTVYEMMLLDGANDSYFLNQYIALDSDKTYDFSAFVEDWSIYSNDSTPKSRLVFAGATEVKKE